VTMYEVIIQEMLTSPVFIIYPKPTGETEQCRRGHRHRQPHC
jgi:hypothetical protein